MKSIVLLFITSSLLASCTSIPSNSSYPNSNYAYMFSALDVSPDGFEGKLIATGETFKIESTYMSSTKLCRIVVIEDLNTFLAKSFCKIKGGEWR